MSSHAAQSRPPTGPLVRSAKAVPRLVPSPHPPPPHPAPTPERTRAQPPVRAPGAAEEADVALQLAIGREGIGLELARPARIGCLLVTELTATLPGLRFPIAVSGGVPRFRHRRGALTRIVLELGARALERWAAPRLRGVVGTRTPEVWVGARRDGATMCIAAPAPVEGVDELAGRRGLPVLVFDVHLMTEEADLVLVVAGARGTGLPAPASALAIACVEALVGRAAERRGAVFTFRRAADTLARALLPEAGARVPDAGDARWAPAAATPGGSDAWVLVAQTGALASAPTEEALRAREAAMLLRDADDALVAGDLDGARAQAVEALEHAPRHPALVRRILEVDARAGGRAEAALAMLVELRGGGEDHARFGTTPGELLAETGDTEAALASLERAGQTEEAPALAARAYEIAADLARDPIDAGVWLDRAIARTPRSVSARWARVGRRLELGRLEDALADVEHLEAMGRGNRARYAVWLRAGRAWDAAGLSARAGALYERALRYAPEEPEALAGLGAALVKDGAARERARGVAVLTRACEIADARRAPSSRLLLDLGRAFAGALEDLPAAIARVSAIPIESPEAAEARGLEGRWRARLGDLAGAALSFARLRDLAASIPVPQTPAEHRRAEAIATMLAEAAEMERTRMHDPLGAQRYLGAALRLRPQDPELRSAYREVGALIAGRGTEPPEMDRRADTDFPESEEASATHHRPISDRPSLALAGQALPKLDLSLASEEDTEGAARVEDLSRRLQANPADDLVVDELLALLESLGRGHELLALVSARLEDATTERRADLAPRARAALERMAAAAVAAGSPLDASLFRDAISALGLTQ